MILRTGRKDRKIIREMKQEEDQASIILAAMRVIFIAKRDWFDVRLAHEP